MAGMVSNVHSFSAVGTETTEGQSLNRQHMEVHLFSMLLDMEALLSDRQNELILSFRLL